LLEVFITLAKSLDNPIDEIFTKQQQNEMKKQMEPIRPVHYHWIGISKENNIIWESSGTAKYTNSREGGVTDPSSAMLEIARKAKYLADVFLFIVQLALFVKVSSWTEKYCYNDWVIEKFGRDRYGKAKKQRHFKDVPAKKSRCIYPGRRHRAQKERKKYFITPGFIMCRIAIIILQGGHFETDKRSAQKMWRAQPYGVSIS